MTPYQKRLTPITRRMAEDMKIRNRAQATIDAYNYHVGKFEQLIGIQGKQLEDVCPEDVRTFQLHLIEERKVGWSSFNQAVCSLRFLYSFTLPRSWPLIMVPFGKRPKRLPTVLSNQEVEALLELSSQPRPSWKEIFDPRSDRCPDWYRRSLLKEEHAFWDDLMGDGFSDWYDEYLKTQAESARDRPRPSPAIQLRLPGVCPAFYD